MSNLDNQGLLGVGRDVFKSGGDHVVFLYLFIFCVLAFFLLMENRKLLLLYTQTRKDGMIIDCYGMNFDYLFLFFFFFCFQGQLGAGEWDKPVLYVDYLNDLY
jgi:hypothetical protein